MTTLDQLPRLRPPRPPAGASDRLSRALESLDPVSRSLLDLSLRRGMSARDIAELVDSSPATVTRWIDDALFHVASDVGARGTDEIDALRGQLAGGGNGFWRDSEAPEEAETAALLKPPRTRTRARVAARWAELGSLALIPALVLANDVWAAQAALIVLLLVVPGRLLLRALRVRGEAIVGMPVYVPCASLVVLLATGLAVDMAGPPLGIDQPLRAAPLLAGLEAVCLVLFAFGARAGAHVDVPWRALSPRLRNLWPMALPALAAVGALRLTNGHGSAVAVAAMAAAALALLVCTLAAGRIGRAQLALVLYGVGLAAAWSFSLRGHFVFGFDISSEYHVLSQTLTRGVWHSSHPHDAYGAMLSLTVLPALLHALAGTPAVFLLKVVYPAIFALFPVALFWLGMRFLTRRWAFVAAAFVAVQSYFFEQLIAIARQEIALVLFVGLVAAVLDRRLPRWPRWSLIALLALGVVVSHYSTAYLAVATLAMALVLQLGLTLLRRRVPGVTASVAVAAVFLVAGAVAWYGPVTHSGSNATDFVNNVRDRGLDLLPGAKPGQSLVQTYLSGNTPHSVGASRYERLAGSDYAKNRPYVHPLKAADSSRYALQSAKIEGDGVRVAPAYDGLKTAEVAIGQLANLLAVLGALVLVLRRRTRPLARQLGLLAAATLLAVGLLRLSGTAANAYNQERAFVQTMVALAPAMAWGLQALATRFRRAGRALAVAAAVGLVVVFAGTSGLRGEAVGGGTAANVSDQGEDFERFYVTAPELASADWLASQPNRALTYTDRYGQLRVLAATGQARGLMLDPTPKTLDHDAWLYASRTNTVAGRARAQIGTSYATFRWPDRFLADQFDTVYSNGTTAVYHR